MVGRGVRNWWVLGPTNNRTSHVWRESSELGDQSKMIMFQINKILEPYFVRKIVVSRKDCI